MSPGDLCWIDRLAPDEFESLDATDRIMVVDELRFRREQMVKLQLESLLVTTMLTLPILPSVPQNQDFDPDALADQIAKRVAERLGSGRTADIYTTRKGGPHVPGKSRDWMLRRIKEMPGARQVGRDWQIAHSAFEQWLTEQDTRMCKAVTTTSLTKTPDNVRDIAEAALARAGFRATK